MYILSLETSTKVCAVALHQAGTLIAETRLAIEQAHSSKLTVLIEQLLENASIQSQDLRAVAVSAGPGSYTGLRIGVSVGKGLCFALQIPLLSINTLEAMAWQVRQGVLPTQNEKTFFCPMLDARRMEVYCAVFDGAGKYILPTEAKIIDNEAFSDILPTQQIVFFGEGAAKCKPFLTHSNALFLKDILPTADSVGKLAYPKFQQQIFEHLAYFEPFYLKDFVNNTKIK
jgi:tRNA threonylcarbamoyladenosine biosynthesis protein TsaB